MSNNDDQLINALLHEESFTELPQSFAHIDIDNMVAVRMSLTPNGDKARECEVYKKDVALDDWNELLASMRRFSTIDQIDVDNHLVVTEWKDAKGQWHLTFEGDALRAMME